MKFRITVLVMLLGLIQIFPQQNEYEKFFNNKLNTRTIITEKTTEDVYLLTESIEQEWISSGWQNVSRYNYYYDSSNTNYLTTIEAWDNNQWVNETQYWPFVDENGKIIEEIYKAWVDSDWVNSERYLYEYDVNENVTVETSQAWNTTEWINSNRTVYTYLNDNLTAKLYQQWNISDWSDVERFQYNYVNNNLTEELFQQYIMGWNNVSLIQNSYNAENKIIETLNKRWDNGNWFLEQRQTHQYSNGELTVTTLYEGWIDTVWMNISLHTQTFNSNNLLIEFIGQYWHSINGWINQQRWVRTYTPDNKFLEWVTQFWQTTQWENFSRLISYYDTNGNETVFAWEMWENSAWQNHIQILYNYTVVSDIEENLGNELNYLLSQNYPNPFNPTTKINWQSPVSAHQSLRVYDVLGNEVAILVDEYKPAGKYEIDFNAVGLSSGIYLIRLETNNYVNTKKMILIK
ncbi:MAG: T9SS type A sorting domain-containing protein [Ignavibacterium sp.]|nr:T9SS type A sorting domain-containing protein [Ignavibacterium sp.]